MLLGIDINSRIYESDMFSTWCLGANGGKHPGNFPSMCKCVAELGIVFPAGDESKHSNAREYGTYNLTVGSKIIVVDQIGIRAYSGVTQ